MEYTHGINYINIAHFLEVKGILQHNQIPLNNGPQ